MLLEIEVLKKIDGLNGVPVVWSNYVDSYLDARNVIQELNRVRWDKRTKSKYITNWAKIIQDYHQSFLFHRQPTVNGDGPVNEWELFYQNEHLILQDQTNIANCVAYGHSVEIVEYDGSLKFRKTDPRNWSFIMDDMGEIDTAIYKITIPAMTVVDGELSTQDTVRYYVYDSEFIHIYEAVGETIGYLRSDQHSFGEVPIIRYQICDDYKPFLTHDILSLTDAYQIGVSALADEIVHNVDSLLKTVAVEWKELLQEMPSDSPGGPVKSYDEFVNAYKNGTFAGGTTVLDYFMGRGFLPLGPDSDAEYLTRDVNVQKFTEFLTTIRQAIYQTAKMADVDDAISGAQTGSLASISQAALRLLFHKSIQQATSFSRYYDTGFKKRIDFWNFVNEMTGGDVIVNYDVAFRMHLPQNMSEIIQYMPNLITTLPLEERLKMLEIKDFEEVAVRMREELKMSSPEEQTAGGALPVNSIMMQDDTPTETAF